MNDDIKKGAAQMAAGIKAEAKDFAEEAKEKLEKFKDKFDKDADGKIEFQELSDNVVDETKKSLDKLAKMFKDDNLSDKAKSELNEAFEDFRNKIQPALDAAKKEVAEKAEEIRPVIDNLKEKVDEKLPEEVKTEDIASGIVENEFFIWDMFWMKLFKMLLLDGRECLDIILYGCLELIMLELQLKIKLREH